MRDFDGSDTGPSRPDRRSVLLGAAHVAEQQFSEVWHFPPRLSRPLQFSRKRA
jgi:hypothetical protein